MRVLLDECVPRQLRRFFPGHQVSTVTGMRWSGIKNGRLLALAEDRFDVLLTVDRSIPFQQNLSNRDIAVIVLIAPDRKVETLRPLMQEVLAAFDTIQPGDIVHIRG